MAVNEVDSHWGRALVVRAEALGRGVDAAACGVVVIAVAAFTAITTVQVFCRYVLGWSLFWSDELSRFLFAWAVFVGASSALRRSELVGFDLVYRFLAVPIRRRVKILCHGLVLGFLTVPLVFGGQLVAENFDLLSPSLQIPMAWVYLAVPVGSAFMFLQALVLLVRSLSFSETDEGTVA